MKLLYFTDPHGSGTGPRNRIDDYREALTTKIREVFDLARKYAVDGILVGGDFWNAPEVSISVLLYYASLYNESPVPIYGTPGNHDIFGYNLATYERSSLRLLEMLVPKLQISTDPMYGFIFDNAVSVSFTPYSGKMDLDGYGYSPTFSNDLYKIHVAHGMLLDHTPPFDRFTLIQEVKTTANLVLTGHDHIGYGAYERADGVVFINPGSLTRIQASVAEIERPVRALLITVEGGKMVYEFLPITSAKPGPEVLDRSSIEAEAKRQYAMDQFSALIQTHTGGRVLLDLNDIIQTVAKLEKYGPDVVKSALEEINAQYEKLGGSANEWGFPKIKPGKQAEAAEGTK